MKKRVTIYLGPRVTGEKEYTGEIPQHLLAEIDFSQPPLHHVRLFQTKNPNVVEIRLYCGLGHAAKETFYSAMSSRVQRQIFESPPTKGRLQKVAVPPPKGKLHKFVG